MGAGGVLYVIPVIRTPVAAVAIMIRARHIVKVPVHGHLRSWPEAS